MIPLLAILALWIPGAAFADEKPCRQDGQAVVCTREGFDTLVAKVVDARREAERCALLREADAADQKVLEARIVTLMGERELARAEAERLRHKPFPTGRMLGAVGLGVLAGVAAALVPQVSSEAGSTALGGLSVASAAVAAFFVLSE